MVEQLFCKQQVIGSIPVASSIFFCSLNEHERKIWVRFRSGQTDQTVNLAASAFEGSIPSLTTIVKNVAKKLSLNNEFEAL